MSDQSRAAELNRVVEEILSRSDHKGFEEYWKLYKESVYISKPLSYFVKVDLDGPYCNVAVVGEGKIVDVEKHEQEGIGLLSVRPYHAISSVTAKDSAVEGLPRTEGALLTVYCRGTGSGGAGPYWSATTTEEKEQLRSFFAVLTNTVFSESDR